MGWCDETGEHEGWIQPVFNDGEAGTGTSSGQGVIFDAYTDHERVRPFSEITHLRMACECGWHGTTVAIADMPASEVDARYNDPTEVGEKRFLGEWRQHIAAPKRLYDLRDLAERRRDIDESIRDEVAAAREAGASWTDIGRALGMTKQAAQQRFGGHV